MTRGGPGGDEEEGPLRRAPQLAVLLEGDDRKGLLHDMTAAILRHGGDIVLVEIIERGARSVIYWELDGIDDPEGLQRSFLEIDVHAILGGLRLGHLGEQPGRFAAKAPPLDVPMFGHADGGKVA